MNNQRIVTAFLTLAGIILLASCVSKKKFLDSQIALRYSKNDSTALANKINSLEGKITQLNKQIADLSNQNDVLSAEATSTQNKLKNQLNSSQQAYAEQQKKLEQLQAMLDQQKRKAAELKKKMSDALKGFSSSELTVSQKNGKVYVSLSENLLFPSASAVVNEKGKEALGKLAEVLNINPDIAVNIEGHTDSIPIRGKYEDNWALSVARATSIVRILVNTYLVDPTRVIASGHSQFDPIESNTLPEGRAKNRRTEIILSPKLDELYKMLEN